jgi:hypothetical protein
VPEASALSLRPLSHLRSISWTYLEIVRPRPPVARPTTAASRDGRRSRRRPTQVVTLMTPYDARRGLPRPTPPPTPRLTPTQSTGRGTTTTTPHDAPTRVATLHAPPIDAPTTRTRPTSHEGRQTLPPSPIRRRGECEDAQQ